MYAHASGFNWDEGLLVLAPIAVVFCLLKWGRRRGPQALPLTWDERNR